MLSDYPDNTIVVPSWNALQDALFADSWNDELGRFRSRFAFRGLADVDYMLSSTLIRLGGPYAQLERHLLRTFRKYAHQQVVERDSLWHWLAVAKHYGLPARLLDWTYSPYVALHFATHDLRRFDCDGVIWAVNYDLAHDLLPDLLKQRLRAEGASVFTTETLSKEITTFNELATLAADEFCVFFEPPSIDERIVNQFAFFSMMSDPQTVMDEWLTEHPEIWRRIIIPAEMKWEVRDKLDQANITERILFPGLDGLSSWIKRHYTSKDEV